MNRRGFTLLEVIVALGIFAVGATTAFALLVAGAAAGRRAEHRVNTALIAEQVLNDIQSEQLAQEAFDLSEVTPAAPTPSGANSETVIVISDRVLPAYPDYHYDVAITPAPGPVPDRPWLYLVEVEIRWSEKGQGRSAHYATLMQRGTSAMDLPRPGAP